MSRNQGVTKTVFEAPPAPCDTDHRDGELKRNEVISEQIHPSKDFTKSKAVDIGSQFAASQLRLTLKVQVNAKIIKSRGKREDIERFEEREHTSNGFPQVNLEKTGQFTITIDNVKLSVLFIPVKTQSVSCRRSPQFQRFYFGSNHRIKNKRYNAIYTPPKIHVDHQSKELATPPSFQIQRLMLRPREDEANIDNTSHDIPNQLSPSKSPPTTIIIPTTKQAGDVLRRLRLEEEGHAAPLQAQDKVHSGEADTGSSSFRIKLLSSTEHSATGEEGKTASSKGAIVGQQQTEARDSETCKEEATSTPAAGQLTDTKECVRQKQC
jgi:hypothetical protein